MAEQETAATCLLHDPPEPVTGLLDHLRLLHPDVHGTLTARPGPDPDLAAPFARPVITEADLRPYGACCVRCDAVFQPGDPYCEIPEGAAGGIPIVSMVCVPCGGVTGG